MLTTIIECVDLDAELAFFRDVAACRVHLVSPADDPRRVVLHASSGGAVELVGADVDRPVVIAIDAEHSDHLDLVSPGGSVVTIHVANDAVPRPWVATGMAARDTGIGAATGGLAGAVVVGGGSNAGSDGPMLTHHGEFVLVVGLSGDAMLDVDGRAIELVPRASVALPAGTCWSWTTRSDEHSALIVTLPADTVELV